MIPEQPCSGMSRSGSGSRDVGFKALWKGNKHVGQGEAKEEALRVCHANVAHLSVRWLFEHPSKVWGVVRRSFSPMVSLPAFLTNKAATTTIFNHGGPLTATGSSLLEREATGLFPRS